MSHLVLKLHVGSYIKLVLYFLLFFHFQPLIANKADYRYKKAFDIQKLSLEQGLSQSVVNAIAQDKNGFIWLATEDGLNRFDGYEFIVYQHDHKNKSSLHENWVTALSIQDNKGIWLGTVSGPSFFDFSTRKFTNYGQIFPIVNQHVRDVIFDKDSGLWVATYKGLFYRAIDSENDSPFLSIATRHFSKSHTKVISLTSSDEYIFASTDNCILRINKFSHETVDFCAGNKLSSLIKKSITTVYLENNNLWIGTESSGLYQYEINNDALHQYTTESLNGLAISSDYVQDIASHKDGSIWITTINGISIYDRNTHRFTQHTQSGLGKNQLSASDILSIFIDSSGLVWLGTYGRGVNLLNPNQQRFEHIFTPLDAIKLNSSNTIHGLEKDQYENLWLASYGGGLIKYNLVNGKITRPLNDLKIEYDHYVFSLLVDKDNLLWVGTFSEILLFDIQQDKIIEAEIYLNEKKVNTTSNVNNFYEDHSGHLWVLSESGLYKKVNSTSRQDSNIKMINFEDWTNQIPFSYREKISSVSVMAEDNEGNFWIGGDAGLLLYELETQKWQHFVYDNQIPNSLSNNSVYAIYIDSQGFVWVGTADGLNLVKKTGSAQKHTYYFERITTHEGLPSNAIYGIQQDDNEELWLSTSQGLVKYSQDSKKMDLYKSIDGLSSNEFNLAGSKTDEDDRIYFSSINGVTAVVNPKRQLATTKSQLKFVKVKLGDKDLDTFKLNSNNETPVSEVNFGTTIEIWVSAMNYLKLGLPKYRYRLQGAGNEWTNLGGNHKLFIAGLAEGSYVIEIQTRIAGEPWPSHSIKLPIKVNANFFKSVEFIFLSLFSLFFLFALILLLVKNKYNKLLKAEKNKQSIEKLRVKELRVDNDALIYTVSDKDRNILKLNNDLKKLTSQLGVERYRDIATGFYRFNFITDVDESIDTITNQKDAVNLNNYTVSAIFEFVGLEKLFEEYGLIESKEFLSQVSIDLRRETSSNTQFFTIQDGTYILFSASENKNSSVDLLINLHSKFNRKNYDIANGKSFICNTRLTLIHLEKLAIKTKNDLVKVKNLIEYAHAIEQYNEQSMRHFDIVRELSCDSLTDDFDFEVLFQDGTIKII